MKLVAKNKGWCQDQDKIIVQLVAKYGNKNWALISDELHQIYSYPKRTGKQCRQRWHNHLDPQITKKSWTQQEQDNIFKLHQQHGNKWTLISSFLPGRTDNSIKNHFYSTLRKSLRRMSKLLGSKNSTFKMRQIKPSTLSRIFTLAQKSEQGQNTIQIESCKQLAKELICFSREKIWTKNYTMNEKDRIFFQRVLDKMSQLNTMYESQKIQEAKAKKLKQLERNFDEVASSSSGSESYEQQRPQKDESQQNVSISGQEENKKKKQQQFTRSCRKIKKPAHYGQQIVEDKNVKLENKKKNKKEAIKYDDLISKSMKKEKREVQKSKDQDNLFLTNNILISSAAKNPSSLDSFLDIIDKDQQKIAQQTYDDKFDFDLHIQDVDIQQIDQLCASPGIRNTPMAITPKTYSFMKDNNCIPLQNDDCNVVVNKIVNQIKRNTNNDPQGAHKNIFLPSPSSAFRQCY